MVEQRASKRQQELLGFVDGFIKGNGYGPSYREIMRALDYKSVSTVATHIDNLIAKGYLARRDKSARSLEVVSMRPEGVAAKTNEQSEALDDLLLQHIKGRKLNETQLATVREAADILKLTKVMDEISRTIDQSTDHATTD